MPTRQQIEAALKAAATYIELLNATDGPDLLAEIRDARDRYEKAKEIAGACGGAKGSASCGEMAAQIVDLNRRVTAHEQLQARIVQALGRETWQGDLAVAVEAEVTRANGNGATCSEAFKTLRAIRDNAVEALRMPWLLDASPPAALPVGEVLIDWAFIYATEGHAWPGADVTATLMKLAELRAPTQDDADSLQNGDALKTLLRSPASSVPSTDREEPDNLTDALVRVIDGWRKTHPDLSYYETVTVIEGVGRVLHRLRDDALSSTQSGGAA